MGGFGSRQPQSQATNVGNIIKRDPSNLNIANYRRNYDNNEKCVSSQLLFGQGISHKSPTRFGNSTNNQHLNNLLKKKPHDSVTPHYVESGNQLNQFSNPFQNNIKVNDPLQNNNGLLISPTYVMEEGTQSFIEKEKTESQIPHTNSYLPHVPGNRRPNHQVVDVNQLINPTILDMAREEEKKGSQFDDAASLASSNINHANTMNFLRNTMQHQQQQMQNPAQNRVDSIDSLSFKYNQQPQFLPSMQMQRKSLFNQRKHLMQPGISGGVSLLNIPNNNQNSGIQRVPSHMTGRGPSFPSHHNQIGDVPRLGMGAPNLPKV